MGLEIVGILSGLTQSTEHPSAGWRARELKIQSSTWEGTL